jgi:hypothetical protein
MTAFDPSAYGPVLGELLRVRPEMPLGRGRPNRAAEPGLRAATLHTAFPVGWQDENMARACLAGLWLAHNFLDESHELSQQVRTPTGGFWHGIMHRREGDFGNSKYWFRQVGRHPIFGQLQVEASALAADVPGSPALGHDWDPFAFVDLCEAAERRSSPAAAWCQAVQRREWELLFDFCYRSACGRPPG